MLDTPIKTKLSSADFWAFVTQPDYLNRHFERIEGEIVEMAPSGTWSSMIASNIMIKIGMFVMEHHLGVVTGEAGAYEMTPHDTLAPDVAFTSFERIRQTYPDGQFPRTGFAALTPDLCVEVKSPTDSKRQLRQKVEIYLKAGAKLVWLIFPETQTAEVYTPDADVVEVPSDGVLEGGAILPGFSTPLSAIFPG